jgi:CubicO group peptidase (beta-lactamase class C family)
MKLAHYYTLLMAIIITGAMGVKAQSGNPELDDFFEKKMKKSDRIGMQAAYISKGELTWTGNYGVKTFQTGDDVNDSTVFMTASISKPVTALAVMKLYDQRKIDLDADINNYLPFHVRNPNYPEDAITARMLLCHLSSVRDNWNALVPVYTLPEGGDSPLSLEAFLKEYLLPGGSCYNPSANFYQAKPLTEEHYSNVGYALLGLIVESVSGLSFNTFMAEEVFKPLKMNNTFWFLSEIPHQNLATPHNLPYKETDFKGTQILPHYGYPEYPSGQLRTTISDYAQFVKLMLNQGLVDGRQFLSEQTVDEFLQVQYPEVAKWRAISWSYNEFENFIYNMIMPRLPSHTGLDPGVSTVVSFNPETRTGVLIFSNSPTTNFWNQKIIYLDMVKRLFKEAEKAK